jgi:hypothetical protein
MDLTQAGNLSATSSLPIIVFVEATNALAATNQNYYNYVQGTTQANGKLQCFSGAAEKTAAQAMNAGGNQFGDTIRVIATFPRR